MNNETSFFIPDYQFRKVFYVSLGNNFLLPVIMYLLVRALRIGSLPVARGG